MKDKQKTINLKLDLLKATRNTINKNVLSGTILEQQQDQEDRLIKDLLDLGVPESVIKDAKP